LKLVVKIGGSILKNGIPAALLEDVKEFALSGHLALVHGGADLVTDVAGRLGKEQRFITSPEGVRSRYTDRETAEIYTMVMSGMVAKRILLALTAHGVKAVTISGLDGQLLTARRKKKLLVVDERGRKLVIEGGYTGKVELVNSGLFDLMMSNGYVPIVSPVAISDENEPLNIDGDRAAAAIAGGTKADAVVFLTNTDGLLLDGKLVRYLSPSEARRKLPSIGFGMQKKVMASIEAVEAGVKQAVICSGLKANPLHLALSRQDCTVIA